MVLGVWKALSGFAATITLFALMVSALLVRGRRFTCADGPILLGGGLMTVSAFFTFSHGAMGGGLRYSVLIQNATFSLAGMSWMLIAWPVGYGVLSASLAFLVMVGQEMAIALETLRWRVLLLLLLAVSITQWLLVGVQWSDVSSSPPFFAVIWQSASCTVALAVAALALFCFRQTRARSAVMYVALSLLVYSYLHLPFSRQTITNFLSMYGPGCWLLLLGNACILGASITTLYKGLWQPEKDRS